MLSEELRTCLKPILAVKKIIWFALTLSIPFYLAVAHFRERAGDPGVIEMPPWMAPAFAAAAFAAAGFSLTYRRRALSDERLRARLRDLPELPVPPEGQEVPPSLAAKMRAYRALAPPERRLLALAGSLIVPHVICLAANEAVAVFGFALAILLGRVEPALPFAVAALALNIQMYPRTEEVLLRLLGWAEAA